MTAGTSRKKGKQISKALQAEYAHPEDSLGYLCRVAFRRFARLLEQDTIKHDVSSGQWRFLRVLWEEEGISQRELSRRVDMREPTTVVAIKGLEKAGFVRRVKDDKDRRVMRVYLTDEARALKTQLMPYVVDVNERAIQGVSDEDLPILGA